MTQGAVMRSWRSAARTLTRKSSARFRPREARLLRLVCREIGLEFGLGQTAGRNQPFPQGGNRGGFAARLRRINEISARPQRGFADWCQEPSSAQLIGYQRQGAHHHAKPLERRLDRKVEVLEDLIA